MIFLCTEFIVYLNCECVFYGSIYNMRIYALVVMWWTQFMQPVYTVITELIAFKSIFLPYIYDKHEWNDYWTHCIQIHISAIYMTKYEASLYLFLIIWLQLFPWWFIDYCFGIFWSAPSDDLHFFVINCMVFMI